MNLQPTERPDHAEFRRLLAEIERVAQERERLDLECGGLRQDLAHVQAELRLARRDGGVVRQMVADYFFPKRYDALADRITAALAGGGA